MLHLENVVIQEGAFTLRANFAVPAGARVAVLGPSGAGKSTLLSALGGFLSLHAGRIVMDGADVTQTPPGDRPVATLFQDANLFPHLTAAQNVGLALRPDLRLSRDAWAQVDQALDRVGLSGMGPRLPATLSGGQHSRVALARVLLQGRKVVLLDEPFAALGPALKAEMLDLVADVVDQTGATMLMVSHDPADARRITHQAILVADGVAAAPASTDALLDNPPAALRAYLGD